MTAICYTTSIDTMGEATDAEARRFLDALQAELERCYPDADVEVRRDDRVSSTVVWTSGEVDAVEVSRVAHRVWDRGDFDLDPP